MSVRACYVTLEYPVLSQTFVTDEVAALRRAGAEVVVVSLEGDGADVPLGRKRARSRWTLSRVAALLVRRPGAARLVVRGPLTAGMRLKVLAAAEEARRRGCTAVHAHFAYRSADAAEIIGAALGTGHSLTAHARDLFVPEGDVGRRLERARVVVTVCEYNRRWIADRHPAALGKVVVIPACTDVERPPARRSERAVPVVISVGRLVDKKGFDLLIDASAKVALPHRVVIVGGGPLEGALRERARERGVAARVEFAGPLAHEQALALLSDADVYCGAYRVDREGDRDSMPVVVKEAMVAGLPVVATDVVGVPEMVVDGETGVLVPPDDVDALASALERLLADPALRCSMGARGRAVVRERFDIRAQAERLLAEVLT